MIYWIFPSAPRSNAPTAVCPFAMFCPRHTDVTMMPATKAPMPKEGMAAKPATSGGMYLKGTWATCPSVSNKQTREQANKQPNKQASKKAQSSKTNKQAHAHAHTRTHTSHCMRSWMV